MYICNYKSSRTRNLVAQRVVSCLKNAQKLTYMHLQFQKYFRGYIPGPSLKWGGVGMGWEEGRGGSCVPNDFSFRCAALTLSGCFLSNVLVSVILFVLLRCAVELQPHGGIHVQRLRRPKQRHGIGILHRKHTARSDSLWRFRRQYQRPLVGDERLLEHPRTRH
jgi:hypothetical protein